MCIYYNDGKPLCKASNKTLKPCRCLLPCEVASKAGHMIGSRYKGLKTILYYDIFILLGGLEEVKNVCIIALCCARGRRRRGRRQGFK